MLLEPQGLKFVTVGWLPGRLHNTARRTLQELGATFQKEINSKTQVVLVGEGANPHTVAMARMRPIHVLNQEQVATLVAHGQLELPDPAQPDLSFEAVIGELRGALDGAPSSHAWSHIIHTLERCAPERLEDAVVYAEAGLEAWDEAEVGVWEPLAYQAAEGVDLFDAATFPEATAEWLAYLPQGELRVAPPAWVREMVQGGSSPKHRLVRALNLESMYVTGAMLSKVLGGEHLQNVRLLNLGRYHNQVSKSFFRKLRSTERMRSIEELWMSSPRESEVVGLDGATRLERLRTVRFLEHTGDLRALHWRALFDTTSFAQVETITSVWGIPFHGWEALVERPPPALRRLELHTYDEELLRILDSGVCGGVQELALFGPTGDDALLGALLLHPEVGQLSLVDLSGLTSADESSISDMLVRVIPRAHETLAALGRLVLGPHGTPEVCEVLEGLEIESPWPWSRS